MLLGCRSQQGIPDFAYAAVTLFGRPFTGSFRYPLVFWPCRRVCRPLQNGPTTPNGQRRQAWHPSGLGSSRFARRYYGDAFCSSGYMRCFSSPGALRRLTVTTQRWRGCPIRRSWDQRLLAAPPRLSQQCHVLHRHAAPRHPPYAHTVFPEGRPDVNARR